MPGILKRTVFVDDSDGYTRPHEFNLVITGLGPMLEPNFAILPRTSVIEGPSTFDPTDAMSRVDRIERISLDNQQLILGDHVHGGTLMPRTGR